MSRKKSRLCGPEPAFSSRSCSPWLSRAILSTTIKVKVTVDGDKISKIEVLSHGETAGVSDPAFETVPDAIIAAQSTDVDVAAGASFSSKGIIDAVKDALAQAGL